MFRYKGVEADDLAAYIVKHRNRFGIEYIHLVSSDKDWDLLIDEDVSRFSYVTRKDVTFDNWEDHYSIDIKDYATYKALTGDKGDNVIGVEGIGPKRAESIIREYGDVFEIYSSLPLPGKQKFITKLNEFGDKLLLNMELMDLLEFCEEAIGEENCADMECKLIGACE